MKQAKRPEVVEGYLVVPWGLGIPHLFWERVGVRVNAAGLLEEFRADHAREFASEGPKWEHDETLFKRWTLRLFGPQTLWPWERGWTTALVDAYLAPVATAEARP